MKPAATPPVVNCPICGTATAWSAENRWKPFCSERCKMIDLGQWATEKYRVAAEEQEPGDESPQAQ